MGPVGHGGTAAVQKVIAGVGLALSLPITAGAYAAIRLTMGKPVFFRQTRAGLAGRPFELVKFRTMRDASPDKDGPEWDHARMTRIGRLLRATSVDELPTLWNVVKGDMALVGPRPLPIRYLDRYTPEEARRLEVKPGVTGLAQVSGRNGLSWKEKFELDVWYVDHRSLALDTRILLRTLTQVVGRKGIDHGGDATMPEFFGKSHPSG